MKPFDKVRIKNTDDKELNNRAGTVLSVYDRTVVVAFEQGYPYGGNYTIELVHECFEKF